MLDLYEQRESGPKHVASIPLKEMVRDFGVKTFWDIQNILDRRVVVRKEADHDSDKE